MDTPANHFITNTTVRKILWILVFFLVVGGLVTAIVGYNRSPKSPPAITLMMQIPGLNLLTLLKLRSGKS